ncbi:isoaspartyl peptidase/L-asparaginase family protein [Dyadobacter sp. CY323]|uniref:isoaspartyl peptidase/L-asparaginase family protein n=1 Tax=Dyadobacter sp. CY323 TaxID=2907302 RepID=UPI001F219982|nr:isoaspartyl peptidase/L-asparaginase [Dyadobacter sp. CY323]MCE6991227.1 isoaspartyl peptidase/L-asparaginase [Dyadobacter sp. CY323]
MFTIAIHGGAGSLTRASTNDQQEEEYKKGLRDALEAGYAVLARGGNAVEAVEKSVMALENNPLFNAGKGSVFTAEGTHETDAAMMCGRTLEAGAIAGVTNVRNPISLARAVMEQSENVLLAGNGAMDFAKAHGVAFEANEYFDTQHRREELEKAQEKEEGKNTGKGTVGAVALDESGNIAVATSTGGITNKKFGRVGDSPVIGGGTYADNHTCAVSCTGDGEFFIRLVTAYDVASLVRYKNIMLSEACDTAIQKLTQLGGEGGLIALDTKGNVELKFNCESMLRAWKNDRGEGSINVWQNEK